MSWHCEAARGLGAVLYCAPQPGVPRQALSGDVEEGMKVDRSFLGLAALAALALSACGGSSQYGGSAAATDIHHIALAATARAARLAAPASLTRPDTPAEFMVAPAAPPVASAPAAPEFTLVAAAAAPASPTVASAPAAPEFTLRASAVAPVPAVPTAAPAEPAPESAPAAPAAARMPEVIRVAAAPAPSAPEFAPAASTAAPMPAVLAPARYAYAQHAYASAPAPVVVRVAPAPAPPPVAAAQSAEPETAAATRRCCNSRELLAAVRLAVRTKTAEVAVAREHLREVQEKDTAARLAVRARTAEVAATRDRLRQAQAAVSDLLKFARADRSRRPELLGARRTRDDAGIQLRAAREAAAAAWAERNRMLAKVAEHAERLRQAEAALRAAEAAAARNAELRWNPQGVEAWRAKQLAAEGHEVELALRLRAYDTVIESAGVIVWDADNGSIGRAMIGQIGRHLFGISLGHRYGWRKLVHTMRPKEGYIYEGPGGISGTWKGAAVALFDEYENNRRAVPRRTTTQAGPVILEYDGATDRVTATIDLSAHPRGAKFITTYVPDFGHHFRDNLYRDRLYDSGQIVGNSEFIAQAYTIFYKEPPDGSVAFGRFEIRETPRQASVPLFKRDVLGRWQGEFGARRVEEPADE